MTDDHGTLCVQDSIEDNEAAETMCLLVTRQQHISIEKQCWMPKGENHQLQVKIRTVRDIYHVDKVENTDLDKT